MDYRSISRQASQRGGMIFLSCNAIIRFPFLLNVAQFFSDIQRCAVRGCDLRQFCFGLHPHPSCIFFNSFTIRSRFFAVFMKVGRWSAWVFPGMPKGFSRRSALR